MKKKIVLFTILVILILLAPRIFIVSMAVIDYFGTNETCSSQPSYIMSVKPFTVITDRGTMYPGDEYVMTGDGAWYGMTTLIFVGSNGAYFYDVSPFNDLVRGQLRIGCRLYVPVGSY